MGAAAGIQGILKGAAKRVQAHASMRPGWGRSLATSLIVAAVSTFILLDYRFANPGHGAEHYYLRENHRAAYRIMQACSVIIMASIAFNLRFVFFEIAHAAMPQLVR